MPKQKRATGYLGELREDRGLSQEQVVLLLSDRFGIHTHKSALSRYETGSRVSPDPLVLWGLAKLYREPLERLILRTRKRFELEGPHETIPTVDDAEADCLRLFRHCTAAVKREALQFLIFKSRSGSPEKGAADAAQEIAR